MQLLVINDVAVPRALVRTRVTEWTSGNYRTTP